MPEPEIIGQSGPEAVVSDALAATKAPSQPVEIGGRNGPEPTRFGDWEKNGRCIDF